MSAVFLHRIIKHMTFDVVSLPLVSVFKDVDRPLEIIIEALYAARYITGWKMNAPQWRR